MAWEDARKMLGWSESDMRHAAEVSKVSNAVGFDVMMAEILKRQESAKRSAVRAMARKLGTAKWG